MKKKSLLVVLISMATVLSSCSKKSEFTTVINHSIATDYSCLNLNSSVFVPYMDNQEFERYKQDNDFVIINEDHISMPDENTSHGFDDPDINKARALVKAGLLTETIKVKQAISSTDHKPVHSTMFDIHMYKFTELGKQTIKGKHISGLLDAVTQQHAFCYGYPQVTQIVNYSETHFAGMKAVDVKYNYKLVGIAKWVNSPEIQAAFPDIKELLSGGEKVGEIHLVKTNDGWQPHL